MRAALVKRSGANWSIEIGEAPKPEPAAGELLVRVHAATVNRTDLGELLHPFFQRLIVRSSKGRKILGLDFAGEVEAVGASVSRFKPGDRLFGICPLRRNGAQADYVVLKESGAVARIPDSVAYGEAVVGEGAYYASATIERFAVGPSTNMLVFGASGAIGSAAAQLAKAAGASVTVAVLPQQLAMAGTLGADRVVDCTSDALVGLGPQFDVVFDAVGKMTARGWRPLLKPGGHFATTDMGPRGQSLMLMIRSAISRSGTVSVPLPNRATAQAFFERLAALMAAGQYRAVIDRSYPLDQISDAYRYVQTKQKAGIVALKVR